MLNRKFKLTFVSLAVLGPLAAGVFGQTDQRAEQFNTPAVAHAPTAPQAWSSVVTAPQLLAELGRQDDRILLIDARPADQYAAGHLPGAINLPGDGWRTKSRKPTDGAGQDLFLTASGAIDVERYSQLLSAAGVRNDHRIVVYGGHGGKADGTVPVSVLMALGHADVRFLDGIGVAEWKQAGGELSTEPRVLAPSTYAARANGDAWWGLPQVLEGIGKPEITFVDVRTRAEFEGQDLRGNRRGGHIPGAVLLDYESLLEKETRRLLPPAQVAAVVESAGLRRDSQLVLYCQTATRTSVVELALKDLGYDRVAVYDASWQEYGNRDDTPIEQETRAPEAARSAGSR